MYNSNPDPRRGAWLDTAALVTVALLVVLPGLGTPPVLMFDEIYYVSDAASHLEVGVGHSFQAHPPLGTWLIASGMALLDSPIGWRLAPAVLGVLAIALLHRLALRLLPPTRTGRILAALAAVLLIADGSWLVLSRTAMLDGPLTTFVLAAVLTAVAARQSRSPSRRLLALAACGAAIGAATAVKWSGALAAPIVAVLLVIPSTSERSSGHRRHVLRSLTAVGLISVAVYGLTWLPFAARRGEVELLTCPSEAAPCPAEGGLVGVVQQHMMQIRYHTTTRSSSSAATPPDYWPLMQQPVGFFRSDCHRLGEPVADPLTLDPACDDELPAGLDTVLYSGNTVVWFGFLALLPLLTAATRRRDFAASVVVVSWSLLWLPWLAVIRSTYLWYMAPTVPFAALGIVAATTIMPGVRLTPVYLRSTVGAVGGAMLAAATPVTGAAAIVGWAIGGLWTPGDTRLSPATTGARAQLLMAGVITAAAVAVAAVMHSSWTVAA